MMRFVGIAAVGAALLFAGGAAAAAQNQPAQNQPAQNQPAQNQPQQQAVQTCKSVDLAIAFGSTGGAAGTVYREVLLTNRAPGACVLRGFPGVSYVDANGNQVGAAAVRVGDRGPLLTLTHGTTTRSDVGFAQVDNFDPADCRKTPVWGIKVFPPDETAPLYLPMPGQHGCAGDVSRFGNQLTVASVRS